jgi:hypothetical protein
MSNVARQEHYNGEWLNNCRDGKGTQLTPEGLYTGTWKEGKRHGPVINQILFKKYIFRVGLSMQTKASLRANSSMIFAQALAFCTTQMAVLMMVISYEG